MGSGIDFGSIAALAVVLAIVAAGLYVGAVSQVQPQIPAFGEPYIPKFASCPAIAESFKSFSQTYRGGILYESLGVGAMKTTSVPAADSIAAPAPAYSATNIQVAGVDEADIVKTDGRYIYTLSNGNLVIAKAYPADEAEVLSTTEITKSWHEKQDEAEASATGETIIAPVSSIVTPREMFIDNETLLIFANTYVDRIYPLPMAEDGGTTGSVGGTAQTSGTATAGTGAATEAKMAIAPAPPDGMYYPYYYGSNVATIMLWDISDRANPRLERTIDFEGSYLTSRKIGSDVYFVVNSYPRYYIMEQAQIDETIVPAFRDSKEIQAGAASEFSPVSKCAEVGFLPPISAESFVVVGSVSMSDIQKDVVKETVVGSGQNVYASLDNLYLAEVEYNYGIMPLVRSIPVVGGIAAEIAWQQPEEKTHVHKFGLESGEITYKGVMDAPGHILNQFSMDEYKNYFRIATTISQQFSETGEVAPQTNNVYVFGGDLKLAGSLEKLAPGESIYAARFMGDRAYLVTFKKIDPLFVIDLSTPESPKVLGKLKIPGYSDYLHPYDETHIIGLGKEAVEAEESRGDFAWYQGIKIALFDVSDVENPREIAKANIGDRGTDSYALHDHKAFLFDRGKNLLVIPVLLAEINEGQYSGDVPAYAYGDFVYQGAYVYNLTLENGFELKGRITHVDEDDESFLKSGYYYYDSGDSVKRSLYIGDVLYTISDTKILANDLSDLGLVKELVIGRSEQPIMTWVE